MNMNIKSKKVTKDNIKSHINSDSIIYILKNNKWALGVLFITFLLFATGLNHDFLNWDDDFYITKNPHITSLSFDGIKNIFSVFVSYHYHPLTLLSLAIDLQIWGYNASGFVLTNIILHTFNVALVFIIFSLISKDKRIPYIVAILFAIHPMRVESVIWMAERKDVLYVFFYLCALFNYIKYLKCGFEKKYYVLTFMFIIISILCKATAASFPLILLLFDFYYKRKNYKRVLIEKIPFFVLSLVFGIVAMIAQSKAVPNTTPLFDKPFLITYALNFYIVKFFLPLFQSPLYPFPIKVNDLLPLKYYVSILIIPFLAYIVYKLKYLKREVVFGLGFFFFSMALLLFRFPIGPAFLAERYTHLPYIGLAFIIASFYCKFEAPRNRFILRGIFICWVAFLTIKTYYQIDTWRNTEVFWLNVVKSKNPNSELAYNYLGVFEYERQNTEKAIYYFTKGIEFNSNYDQPFSNRATIRRQQGNYTGAIEDFNHVLTLYPNNYDVLYSRGLTYTQMGAFDKAIIDFDKLISIQTNNWEALNARGYAHYLFGNFDKALNDYNQALLYNQEAFIVYENLGLLYFKKVDYEKALVAFNQVISLKHDYSQAYSNRASCHFMLNQVDLACKDWEKAYSLGMNDVENLIVKYCK